MRNSKGSPVEVGLLIVNSWNNFKPVPFSSSTFIVPSSDAARKNNNRGFFGEASLCRDSTSECDSRDEFLHTYSNSGIREVPAAGITWGEWTRSLERGLDKYMENCNLMDGDIVEVICEGGRNGRTMNLDERDMDEVSGFKYFRNFE